jgi:trafficking protein particle complex subunit 10
LIGRDLASFYSELNETSKACELIACYNKMADYEKYTKLSAAISSTFELEILVRNFYFDEMTKAIKQKLKKSGDTILCEMTDCFNILSVEVLPSEKEKYIKDSPVKVCFCLESLFPR